MKVQVIHPIFKIKIITQEKKEIIKVCNSIKAVNNFIDASKKKYDVLYVRNISD